MKHQLSALSRARHRGYKEQDKEVFCIATAYHLVGETEEVRDNLKFQWWGLW